MRRLVLAASLALLAAPAVAADPVDGVWLNPSATGKVRLGPCEGDPGRRCGAITWLRNVDPAARDANNRDPKLRNRALIGLPIMWGFRRAGPGEWAHGKIYDPRSGRTFGGKITAAPNGTLKVEACTLLGCQIQTWRPG
jgi:uncharacterized protein (DUF2147 family)